MKQSQSLSNFIIANIKFFIITIKLKYCHCCLLFSYNNNCFQLPLHHACAVGTRLNYWTAVVYIWKYCKYLIEWIHFDSNINKLIKYYYLLHLFNSYCYLFVSWLVCVNDILSDKLLLYKQDFSAISFTSIITA